MGRFFIHTDEGHIATQKQLVLAGLATDQDDPGLPWFPINAPVDATTMWYAAMRKREKGVYIGTLVFRHQPHHTLLLEKGWEEVPVEDIGLPGTTSEISPAPDLG
jgi:hypothetical protein